MVSPGARNRLRAALAAEVRQLTTLHASDRAWQMPFAAALATGLPLLAGAHFGRLTDGLIASLGGLVFLYLPATPLSQRMVSLMASAFGMVSCYAVGALGHLLPPSLAPLLIPMLSFVAIVVTMLCRIHGVGPPGSLFFVMAAAIGAYTPAEPSMLPSRIGLIALGCLLACLIGFVYSLHALHRRAAPPPVPPPQPTFDFVVFDSVVIGVCVGISLALAQALQLDKPYWVPVSCLAVIQGASLRAVWNKQLHRVLGTGIGMALAWGMLMLPLGPWSVGLSVMALCFVIEAMVVRHYGIAVVFITPLTILLAEAATLSHSAPGPLVLARFLDTLLGCAVGLAGAVCLHNPKFREAAGRPLRRLMPSRRLR